MGPGFENGGEAQQPISVYMTTRDLFLVSMILDTELTLHDKRGMWRCLNGVVYGWRCGLATGRSPLCGLHSFST